MIVAAGLFNLGFLWLMVVLFIVIWGGGFVVLLCLLFGIGGLLVLWC